MCIKTDNLPVLTLSDFDTDNYGFILFSIRDFMSNPCIVEQAYKASFFTIVYCKKNGGLAYIDKNEISIKKETIICIGLNSVNRLELEPGTEGYIILFSENFFSLRYNENVLYHFECLRNNNVCYKRLTLSESNVWSFYIRQIKQVYTEKSKKSVNLLRSHLNIILSMVESGGEKIGSRDELSEKNKKVVAFEHLVEQYFAHQKLPSFYAGELCISVNYLNRICNEMRGVSSGEIIRKRVVLEAERLLYHTSKSISEISGELGFESVSYFSTFFKKHTGVAPDSFRKQHK